jgi:predicted oxidoreductase
MVCSQPNPAIGTNRLDRIQSPSKAAQTALDREDWFAPWVAAKGNGIP